MSVPPGSGADGAGAVRLIDRRELAATAAAARAQGTAVVLADLADCRNKAALLQRIARAFAFPPSFGHNWDALADCLGDLGWLPHGHGYAWLFDHADRLRDESPDDFATFRAVLGDACARWNRRDMACSACIAFARPAGLAPVMRPLRR